MIFRGKLRSGDSFFLGAPEEMILLSDSDAPADMLKAKFPCERIWDELSEVEIEEKNEIIFRGIVDEQNIALSSSGMTTELICRSMEALLLDNEACPCVMTSPSLELIEERYLLPLGFTLGECDRSRKQGELTVEKGDSCWTVLSAFCERFLNVTPYVDVNKTVHCEPLEEKERELTEMISAEYRLLPCKRIGEVWQQSYRGTYDTRYAGSENTSRRRYVSLQSGKSPKKLIEDGERSSFRLAVTVPEAVFPKEKCRQRITVAVGGRRFTGCTVKSAVYRRDKNGDSTRLVLEGGEINVAH